MEKIIHKLISEFTKGVDTYTHNGSTWLIFTESKQWVIELTEEKTLWYNYNFFKSVFEYTSMDVVENQQLITKWVEDNIINKVSDIHFRDARDRKQQFEDTLENGSKHTISPAQTPTRQVEGVIENGVKKTKLAHMKTCWSVEDTIENGVKETNPCSFNVSQFLCEEVIDKGVKETKISPTHTEYGDWLDGDERLDEIIKNGVKETKYNQSHQEPKFKEVLKNGVKHTRYYSRKINTHIERIIQNGVKETKQKKNSYLVLDTSGRELILESHLVIRDGVKSSTPRQYVGEDIIGKIIDKGVKETFDCNWDVPTDLIEDVINDGVKETKVCDYVDPKTQLMTIKWGHSIDEVIENGEKIIGTYVGGNRQKENIDSVIGYGTKN
jgi:hypothetical protein